MRRLGWRDGRREPAGLEPFGELVGLRASVSISAGLVRTCSFIFCRSMPEPGTAEGRLGYAFAVRALDDSAGGIGY